MPQLNAAKNIQDKGRMNNLLNSKPVLNNLLEALIDDSFWFCVLFYKYSNKEKRYNPFKDIKEREDLDVLKSRIYIILKRISFNFFRFFIKLCEESEIKKKAGIINAGINSVNEEMANRVTNLKNKTGSVEQIEEIIRDNCKHGSVCCSGCVSNPTKFDINKKPKKIHKDKSIDKIIENIENSKVIKKDLILEVITIF